MGASNYQVRSLAGAGCGAAFLESPAAAEKRLGAAAAVLEQLDVVLVVGTGLLRPRQEELLRTLLQTTQELTARPWPLVAHMLSPDAAPGAAPKGRPEMAFHAMPY